MKHGLLPDPRCCWRWMLVLALAVMPWAAWAATPSKEGQPFMQYFSPRDYHADTQCLCTVQDARGVIYVGNIGSVLEYDGSSWRKIDVGQLHGVAGMAYEARTDTVFVGARDDVGYLRSVPGGARVFVSILDQLPPEARNVGIVFGVYATPEGVFFVGTDRVMRWRDGHFKTWPLASKTRLRSDWAGGHLYVFSPEIGLLRLENEALVPASTDPLFRRVGVRSMLADADGTLVVGTVADGLFALRDGVTQPLEIDCADFLKEKKMLKMRFLRDGSLAIATLEAGLLVLDRARRFRNHVDETGGLRGGNLTNLFEDAEGGLWICLQSGVTRAEINSPLSILRAGPQDDFSNTITDDNDNDKRVLGSDTGLYRVVPASPSAVIGAHLERIPAIKGGFDSFCFVGNGFLTVADGRVALIDSNGQMVPVPTATSTATTVLAPRLHPGHAYVADTDGHVSALHLDAVSGRWMDDGVVAATGEPGSFRVVESACGDLWLGTKDHGLFRAQFTSAGPAAMTSYLDRPGPLQGKRYVVAYDYGGPIMFNALNAVCRLDASGENVEALTPFGPRFSDGSLSFYNLLSTDRQSVWIIARDAKDPAAEPVCGRALAGEEGRAPVFQPLPHKVADVLGELHDYFQVVSRTGGLDALLLCGTTGGGIVRLDVRQWEAQLAAPPPFATLVRRAVIAGQTLPGREPEPIAREPLPYARNSVHFEYAAGTVAFGAAPRFQTRLVNFGSGGWSDFSDRTSVDYLNLPEGSYAFEVRARNADGQSGSVASLPFRILPPWQRSPWAYAAYALAAVLGLFALVRWRGRQLEKSNAVLAALVDARTRELRAREADLLANEQNLVRARDDAETANRAKSAFLANMSHELRTPLNAVLGYAQILLKRADLPERSREQIAVIGQSGSHLLSLINEVLDLSKIEAGKFTLSQADFSLRQLLDEVGAVFRPRFAEKGLAFTENRSPDLPPVVRADPSRLRQVLFNLLGNAVKFTRQGGVRLEVRPADAGRVRFEVTDTGVGIEEGELRDIFLPFHQTGESSLAAQGTGLGLAISQRLIGLLGGRIEVESMPGMGSRFWFELPLPPVEPPDGLRDSSLGSQALGTVTGYEGEARRLLVVDDRTENRSVLRDFLQPLGFEIEEAADGAGCLAACARRLPHGVLLDLRLGGPDGFETARALRARHTGAPLGIIAISASVFESDRQQAIDAGCDDFLPKPFEEARLLGVLGRVLGLRWVQAASAVPAPPSTGDPVEDGKAAPLREETDALLELSLRGDIVGIRKRLDELRAGGASEGTAALVRRLEPLAATYQMDEIHALLIEVQTHAGK